MKRPDARAAAGKKVPAKPGYAEPVETVREALADPEVARQVLADVEICHMVDEARPSEGLSRFARRV